ncbi:hypothetical protein SAMN05444320_102426 [Streptoalloteichus hindustanus]|uniref:Uncharacterized protein n=2 Tax=Streptoalloteichus hindustanus TaxID=2017 RepID=A0A1M4YNI7_STRHI|nr:hypothetical protein SAMN05444320_102426 [Streptoalloteichus hindustanus]
MAWPLAVLLNLVLGYFAVLPLATTLFLLSSPLGARLALTKAEPTFREDSEWVAVNIGLSFLAVVLAVLFVVNLLTARSAGAPKLRYWLLNATFLALPYAVASWK